MAQRFCAFFARQEKKKGIGLPALMVGLSLSSLAIFATLRVVGQISDSFEKTSGSATLEMHMLLGTQLARDLELVRANLFNKPRGVGLPQGSEIRNCFMKTGTNCSALATTFNAVGFEEWKQFNAPFDNAALSPLNKRYGSNRGICTGTNASCDSYLRSRMRINCTTDISCDSAEVVIEAGFDFGNTSTRSTTLSFPASALVSTTAIAFACPVGTVSFYKGIDIINNQIVCTPACDTPDCLGECSARAPLRTFGLPQASVCTANRTTPSINCPGPLVTGYTGRRTDAGFRRLTPFTGSLCQNSVQQTYYSW